VELEISGRSQSYKYKADAGMVFASQSRLCLLHLASFDGGEERDALVSELRSFRKPRRPREGVTSPMFLNSTSPVSP
jgi:hypothetical protein